MIHLTEDERAGIESATQYLKMKISPHIATLMDPDDPNDALRKQFIPSAKEVDSADDELLFADVNADNRYSPVEGLVHRYPTKVLLFPSNYCGCYCRYCFRRKLVRDVEQTMKNSEYGPVFEYLENHPEINEVILSGGDPMVLSNEKLEHIFTGLSKIEHIKIVRIHTRMPITVPYRIDDEFVEMISKFKKHFNFFVVIHVDTTAELAPVTKEAIGRLVDEGVPCFSSCPLLNGINDDEETLSELWMDLLEMRVKPYYLFHSDPVQGLRHFLVPIERGLHIMNRIYDRISGLAIPHYCFNVPDGGGHVLLNYDYMKKIGEGKYLVQNFEGQTFEYNENVDVPSIEVQI